MSIRCPATCRPCRALNDNALTGALPALALPSNFAYLSLADNARLGGPLPPDWRLPNMSYLSLASCNFSGPLPTRWALEPLTALVYLDLSHNRLEGALDPGWRFPAGLQVLGLAANLLHDPIGQQWVDALPASLQFLYLYANDFEGPMPQRWGHVTNLSSLLLSGSGQLSGHVPTDWPPSLATLVLSGNDLSGRWRGQQGVCCR